MLKHASGKDTKCDDAGRITLAKQVGTYDMTNNYTRIDITVSYRSPQALWARVREFAIAHVGAFLVKHTI